MTIIRDVTEAEFEIHVIARSREVPVVVDFWAGWCAPCRMLGPVLEREVEALGGRVELAKLDVDRAQALSARFGIQGIPAVKAFRNGEVAAEFVGARDAAFVRRWLAELAPSAAAQALESASTVPALEALLDDPEVGPSAALKLAAVHGAAGAAGAALAALERIPARHPLHEKAEGLRRQLELVQVAEAFGGEEKARLVLVAAPGDLDAQFALSAALAGKGDAEGAIQGFLAIVRRDRKFRDDGARRALLTLFEQLGPTHPLTQQGRRKLQVLL